jgi:hypothetical protein
LKGDELWLEGSIAKAAILCAARAKFPANQEFGAWLEENIELENQERVALIGLGGLGEKRLREILTTTSSRSYQYIWRDNKPPSLRVVSD